MGFNVYSLYGPVGEWTIPHEDMGGGVMHIKWCRPRVPQVRAHNMPRPLLYTWYLVPAANKPHVNAYTLAVLGHVPSGHDSKVYTHRFAHLFMRLLARVSLYF